MKNIRKAYLQDLEINLQIKHTHFGDNFKHLHAADGKVEKVLFNFEIGYEYNPISKKDSINSVYEYTFIYHCLKELENKIHTCTTEFFLQEICEQILKDSRVYYVKCDIRRIDIIRNGQIGVGLELYKENYDTTI